MTSAAIVIPWRDRGTDPLRVANLKRVREHWKDSDLPVHVMDDGRSADAQFNRSAAYNRGASLADVVVYNEADVLIPHVQIYDAITVAAANRGVVIPFTEYRMLAEDSSDAVREHRRGPETLPVTSITRHSQVVYTLLGRMATGLGKMGIGVAGAVANVGAVNVLSRATLTAVGRWDESFEGHGYDDLAMFHAFRLAAGPPRWVQGPAYHLHHRPGATLDANLLRGLVNADSAAALANYRRYERYLQAETADEIRGLTA